MADVKLEANGFYNKPMYSRLYCKQCSVTLEQQGEVHKQTPEDKTTGLGNRSSFMLFSERNERNSPQHGLLEILRTLL